VSICYHLPELFKFCTSPFSSCLPYPPKVLQISFHFHPLTILHHTQHDETHLSRIHTRNLVNPSIQLIQHTWHSSAPHRHHHHRQHDRHNRPKVRSGRQTQPAVLKSSVTAIDGKLVLPAPASSDQKSIRGGPPLTRSLADYELVFNGTGLSPSARDAAIQGTAYLTFTLLPNVSYNIDGCLRFCDTVPACSTFSNPSSYILLIPSLAFVNLYYEFTIVTSSSDPKCVLYADLHTADEKKLGNPTTTPNVHPTQLRLVRQIRQ
jgi:hypothetical protein